MNKNRKGTAFSNMTMEEQNELFQAGYNGGEILVFGTGLWIKNHQTFVFMVLMSTGVPTGMNRLARSWWGSCVG